MKDIEITQIHKLIELIIIVLALILIISIGGCFIRSNKEEERAFNAIEKGMDREVLIYKVLGNNIFSSDEKIRQIKAILEKKLINKL